MPRWARLVRRSVATLGEAERAPLIEFFRARIQRAREQTAIDGATGEAGAAAHLRSAFDYRDWFAFTLYEVKDGQRAKLTPKRHALGSGGEQAVLVHMPLFAAAAALYASSRDGRAPRLVMLDVAGRALISREVGAMGPGVHTLELAEAGSLRPGVYFLRLAQGMSEVRARAIVLQ